MLLVMLLLLLSLLQFTSGFPRNDSLSNDDPIRFVDRGRLLLDRTILDDDDNDLIPYHNPSKYFYEDKWGNIHGGLQKRDQEDDEIIVRQITDDTAMLFCSQQPGARLGEFHDFAYKKKAGSGVTIIMHTDGIFPRHPEFTDPLEHGGTRGKIRMVQPTEDESGNPIPPAPQDTVWSTGTCLASKAIGKRFGLAKRADLTVVRYVDIDNDEYMIAGLQLIVDTIRKRQEEAREGWWGWFWSWWSQEPWFVVSISYAFLPGLLEASIEERYTKKFLEIANLGALLVFTSGNVGVETGIPEQELDFPAKLSLQPEFENNTMLVSGVYASGTSMHNPIYPTFYVEHDRARIFAPGALYEYVNENHSLSVVGIQCAMGESSYTRKSGVDLTVPQVAALAAYLCSVHPDLCKVHWYEWFEDMRAKRIMDKIVELGYSRRPTGYYNAPRRPSPLSIWNGEEGAIPVD